MRRIPFGGLFLSACLGIAIADAYLGEAAYWAVLFLLFAIVALIWNHTVFSLFAALLFFGFWQSFRKSSDQGFQLRAAPNLSRQIHEFVLEAENDSKEFRWGNSVKQRFFARVTAVDNASIDFRTQAELGGTSIHYGDHCRVRGRLGLPERALNPGEFDERTYLQHQGVYLVLTSAAGGGMTVIDHGWGNPVLALALNCRKAIATIPIRSLENDRPIKALIEGVTFGDRSEFDPDLLNLLQDTGTLHLFVIDGLKVTLLAGISWIAARFFGLPRRWIAGVVIPFIVLYCAATGLSAAGLRATLMALFVLAGVTLEKPVIQLNAMSASGFILLLWNPEELFQLGFQLSFAIVAVIVVAAHPLTSWLESPFRPDPWIPNQLISPARRLIQKLIHRSAELFAVCFICWISSLPFSLFYFHRISFTNVVANFLAVPVGTWILFTALLSILVYPISSLVSVWLNNTNWLLAHLFLVIVNGSASCPHQAINVSTAWCCTDPKIVVLAAGRSETIYFHQGSASGLINPGSLSKYRRITEPFLRTEGVNDLHFLDWTRADGDHYGSVQEAAKHFGVQHLRLYANPVEANRLSKTSSVLTPMGAETIRLDLHGLSWDSATTNTLIRPILKCEVGSFQILLLNANHQQITRFPDQTVDVVLVPSPRQLPFSELAKRFHPRAILCAQGHPSGNHQQEPAAIPIWFLSEKGAVTLALHKNELVLTSYLGDRLALQSRSR